MNCIDSVLKFLSCTLYGHQALDTSHSPAWSCVISTGSFLSVCNSPRSLIGHLYVAVSELEHDDYLGLAEVKLCWRVLIHLTISGNLDGKYPAPFPIADANGVFSKFRQSKFIRVTTTSFCTNYLKSCT